MSNLLVFCFLVASLCSGVVAQEKLPDSVGRHVVLKAHAAHAGDSGFAFSPKGDKLVSLSLYGTVTQWDIADSKPEATFAVGWPGWIPCFSHDGQLLAGLDDDTHQILIWSTSDAKPIETPHTGLTKPRHVLDCDAGAVYVLAFSPNSRMIAAANALGAVTVWNIETGKQLVSTDVTNTPVYAIAFSPNSQNQAFGRGDGKIVLLTILDGTETKFEGHSPGSMITAIAYSPDGALLATSASNFQEEDDEERCRLKLWQLVASKARYELRLRRPSFVYSVAFSPDGNTLATSGGIPVTKATGPNSYESRHLGVVQLWDVKSGQLKDSLIDWYPDPFNKIAFSPDGKMLAAGCDSGDMHLWSFREVDDDRK